MDHQGRAGCLIFRWAVGSRSSIPRADAIEPHCHVPFAAPHSPLSAGRKKTSALLLASYAVEMENFSAISQGSTRHTPRDFLAVLLVVSPQVSRHRRSYPRLKRSVRRTTPGGDENQFFIPVRCRSTSSDCHSYCAHVAEGMPKRLRP
jgi:hypothetical protein